jgi:hypothetical protein
MKNIYTMHVVKMASNKENTEAHIKKLALESEFTLYFDYVGEEHDCQYSISEKDNKEEFDRIYDYFRRINNVNPLYIKSSTLLRSTKHDTDPRPETSDRSLEPNKTSFNSLVLFYSAKKFFTRDRDLINDIIKYNNTEQKEGVCTLEGYKILKENGGFIEITKKEGYQSTNNYNVPMGEIDDNNPNTNNLHIEPKQRNNTPSKPKENHEPKCEDSWVSYFIGISILVGIVYRTISEVDSLINNYHDEVKDSGSDGEFYNPYNESNKIEC